MPMVAPEIYIQHIRVNSKNQKVIYVNLKKLLYMCLEIVMLFYQKLLSDMINKGFSVNPYDPCVVNKMVNGKHMIVTWQVG